MRRKQRVLPKIPSLGLRKKIRRVNRGQNSQRQSRNQEPQLKRRRTKHARNEVKEKHQGVSRDYESALYEPTLPLRPREDHVEAFRVFQIPNQKPPGDYQKDSRDDRRQSEPDPVVRAQKTKNHQQSGH